MKLSKTAQRVSAFVAIALLIALAGYYQDTLTAAAPKGVGKTEHDASSNVTLEASPNITFEASPNITFQGPTTLDSVAPLELEIAPCVSSFNLALSESSLSQPVRDVLTLFTSTLTIKSIDEMMRLSRVERHVLIKDAAQLLALIESSQCAKVKSSVTLGICTVFNGVHYNFQEWMLHYLFLGASHIIVYDTSLPNSTEYHALQSDAKPFVEAGLLTLIPRYRSASESIDAVQMESFSDCYRNTLADVSFIASFDADEFLVLKNASCLPSFMEAYQDFGGLRVPWRTMSPTGVVRHDSRRSFMSQYLYAYLVEPFPMQHHIKTIGNVKYFDHLDNQHYIVSATKEQVNSKFVVGSGPFIAIESTMFDDVELRHFYAPDWAMFVFEKICGKGQGRTQYSTFRAKLLTKMLESADGMVNVKGKDERAYPLDKLFLDSSSV